MVPLEKESVQIQTLQTFHGQRQGKHKLANLVYISIRVANLVRDPNKLLKQWKYKTMNMLSAKNFWVPTTSNDFLALEVWKNKVLKLKLPVFLFTDWAQIQGLGSCYVSFDFD